MRQVLCYKCFLSHISCNAPINTNMYILLSARLGTTLLLLVVDLLMVGLGFEHRFSGCKAWVCNHYVLFFETLFLACIFPQGSNYILYLPWQLQVLF